MNLLVYLAKREFDGFTGRRFRIGKIHDKKVIYVRCGIGMVNLASWEPTRASSPIIFHNFCFILGSLNVFFQNGFQEKCHLGFFFKAFLSGLRNHIFCFLRKVQIICFFLKEISPKTK